MEKMKVNDVKYFKASEILRSSTATRNGIDNTPTDPETIENLNATLERLNNIREGFGKPIYINSGYRCPKVNKLVGGVPNSYHVLGLAVDLRWDADLFKYIMENCEFDKLIREKSKTGMWIHLQFRSNPADERGKVIYLNV
jgi:hypothetical protein